jgi:O-methyltransferase
LTQHRQAASSRRAREPFVAALTRPLRALGVTTLVHRVVRRAPAPVQLAVDRLKLRVGGGRSLQLVPMQELERRYREALQLLVADSSPDALGDYLEFGVYAGSSLTSMYRALGAVGARTPRLFGFDSFEGMPPESEREDEGVWHAGQYRSSLELTRDFLTRNGVAKDRVILVKGWFKDTLTSELVARHGIRRASVIMIDSDLYSSARTALAFCAPLILDRAVIFFDNWNSSGLAEKGLGEKRAFDEFLAEHPEFRATDLQEMGRYKPTSAAFLVERPDGA